ADMGFIPAVRRLLDQTSPNRQTLLFSATLDGDVAELTKRYQRKPARHEVGQETPDISEATHVFWKLAKADRAKTTAQAVKAGSPSIVFCRTRHGADRLAKQLGRSGVSAAAIHGGRTQNQRTRALDQFVSGRVEALVATDVAARGIHVDGVATVVHFDPPEDHKAYVHRSGRTARAGSGGVVVSLLQPEQVREAEQLKRQLGLRQPITSPEPTALHGGAGATETREHVTPAEPRAAKKPRRRNRRRNRKRTPAATAPSVAVAEGPTRPNRKARRAHLQRPGAHAERTS
ncbi:MAG: helicase-related protein, partial [Gaiellaceae bacterium]